jgi:hypothetical protein
MATPNQKDDEPRARDQFIPIRKADVLAALLQHGQLKAAEHQEKFQQFCQLLASIFHHEYFAQLEHLRDGYYYFNPELDEKVRFDQQTLDKAYSELSIALSAVLRGANFVELSQREIEQASRERPFFRVRVKVPARNFREVRFFRRGRHRGVVRAKTFFGLFRKSYEIDLFDDIVLMIATKPSAMPKKERAHLLGLRPGVVFLKYFRNIPSSDLATLFPNVRAIMGTLDRILIGVPAIVGGTPILLKVFSTISVLIAVIAVYIGLSTAVLTNLLGSYFEIPHTLDSPQVESALAGVSALAALGGFLMSQWVRYERKSLQYQKQITDNVYFHNINNNRGIFDYIIGEAEEQECKEAFLAYYFLLTSKEPLDQPSLDARVEDWLQKTFGLDIDFEVDDALAKLDRLGILRKQDTHLSVISLDESLARLDHRWDNFFTFNREIPQSVAVPDHAGA